MTTDVSCLQCGQPFDVSIVEDRFAGVCPPCLIRLASTGSGSTHPEDVPPLQQGRSFRGLDILELLGAGGMGVVYKARQPGLDRFVAVKVLWPRLSSDSEFILRFQREAKAMAALAHPGIVQVHDFGVEAGLCFLVMEFVDGTSLRHVIKGGISTERTLGIVSRLCEALDFAHVRGVVHRDIKPENILVDRDGRVKVADFGLARVVEEAGAPRVTLSNVVMGTPAYMAPEQFVSMKVDARADLYSLAAVFYEMLTGALPVGPFEPPSKRVAIDSRLDDIVMKSLSREPERRHSRALEIKSELDALAADEAPAGAFCDEREARKILGVDVKGLDSLVERGRIRAYQIRSSRAFRRDELAGMAAFVGDHQVRRQTRLAAGAVLCLLLAVGSTMTNNTFDPPGWFRWVLIAVAPVFGLGAVLLAGGALTSTSLFRGRWIPKIGSALTLLLSGISLVVLTVWTISFLNVPRSAPRNDGNPGESPALRRHGFRMFQPSPTFEPRPHLPNGRPLPESGLTAREIRDVLEHTPLGVQAVGEVIAVAAYSYSRDGVDLLVWFAQPASPEDLVRLRSRVKLEDVDSFEERQGILYGVRSSRSTERAAIARARLMEYARITFLR